MSTQFEQIPPEQTSKYFGKNSFASLSRAANVTSNRTLSGKQFSHYIKTEKAYRQTLSLVARERQQAAKKSSAWGENKDKDVSDITDKLGVLMYQQSVAEEIIACRYKTFIAGMHVITSVESWPLGYLNEQKSKLVTELAYVKYEDPKSDKVKKLEEALMLCEAQSMIIETRASNIVRASSKSGFQMFFDLILKHSDALLTVSKFGLELLSSLNKNTIAPNEPTRMYESFELSKQIVVNAERMLALGLSTKATNDSAVTEEDSEKHSSV